MAIIEIANEWLNIATIKDQGGDARYKLVGVAPAIKGFAQVLPGVDEVKRVLESIGQGETCVNRVGLGLNSILEFNDGRCVVAFCHVFPAGAHGVFSTRSHHHGESRRQYQRA